MQALTDNANCYAEHAEKSGIFTLIAQSNAHRFTSKEKAKELKEIEAEIAKREQELKAC